MWLRFRDFPRTDIFTVQSEGLPGEIKGLAETTPGQSYYQTFTLRELHLFSLSSCSLQIREDKVQNTGEASQIRCFPNVPSLQEP